MLYKADCRVTIWVCLGGDILFEFFINFAKYVRVSVFYHKKKNPDRFMTKSNFYGNVLPLKHRD